MPSLWTSIPVCIGYFEMYLIKFGLNVFKCHPKNGNHLYDYEGSVDDDLVCHLCFQAFVDPVDTKCGCTFCSVCLQNYLKRYRNCPLDNTKIEWKQCNKASAALRK